MSFYITPGYKIVGTRIKRQQSFRSGSLRLNFKSFVHYKSAIFIKDYRIDARDIIEEFIHTGNGIMEYQPSATASGATVQVFFNTPSHRQHHNRQQ